MVLLRVFLACLLAFSVCGSAVLAQWDTSWQIPYKVGTKVVCSPVGDDSDWREGVVTESFPGAGRVKVRVGPGKLAGREAGEFIISSEKTIRLAGANSGPPEDGARRNFPASAAAGTTTGAPNFDSTLNFRVGETVLASPSYNSWDWRKGVVVENNPDAPFLRINVEAGNGFAGGVYIVSRQSVKMLGSGTGNHSNATVPPQTAIHNPAAQAGPPPGTHETATAPQTPAQNTATPQVKLDTKASCCPPQQSLAGNSLEAIFKRAIYDRYIKDGRSLTAQGFPTTITFHSFRVSGPRPYKMPEEWAYHTGSPDGPGGTVGTTVYDIKTTYTVCEDEQPNPEYGYKGYVNFTEADVTYVGLKHYKTGVWQVNQSGGKINSHSEKK